MRKAQRMGRHRRSAAGPAAEEPAAGSAARSRGARRKKSAVPLRTGLLGVSAAVAVGAVAEVPVAWFDGEGESKELARLPQRYERRREDTYWYESPTANYAGELVIASDGFALRYPGLWEAEREG